MRAYALVGCLFIASVAGTAQAGPVKLGKYVKVYRGDGGVQASVVAAGEGQVLLKISGVESELDALVFLAREVPASRGAKTYMVQLRGRDFHLFRVEPNSWGGGESFFLYLPGKKQQSVFYDEKESKKASATALLASHNKQKATLAKMAAFDRNAEMAGQDKDLKEYVAEADKACGTSLQVTIDWKTVDDDTLKTISVSGYCGNQLDGLRRACDESEKLKKAAGRLKKAVCSFGAAHKIEVKGDTASFQIDKDKGNQADYAKSVLENALQ